MIWFNKFFTCFYLHLTGEIFIFKDLLCRNINIELFLVNTFLLIREMITLRVMVSGSNELKIGFGLEDAPGLYQCSQISANLHDKGLFLLPFTNF
jgi:hypothetical protein